MGESSVLYSIPSTIGRSQKDSYSEKWHLSNVFFISVVYYGCVLVLGFEITIRQHDIEPFSTCVFFIIHNAVILTFHDLCMHRLHLLSIQPLYVSCIHSSNIWKVSICLDLSSNSDCLCWYIKKTRLYIILLYGHLFSEGGCQFRSNTFFDG